MDAFYSKKSSGSIFITNTLLSLNVLSSAALTAAVDMTSHATPAATAKRAKRKRTINLSATFVLTSSNTAAIVTEHCPAQPIFYSSLEDELFNSTTNVSKLSGNSVLFLKFTPLQVDEHNFLAVYASTSIFQVIRHDLYIMQSMLLNVSLHM